MSSQVICMLINKYESYICILFFFNVANQKPDNYSNLSIRFIESSKSSFQYIQDWDSDFIQSEILSIIFQRL